MSCPSRIFLLFALTALNAVGVTLSFSRACGKLPDGPLTVDALQTLKPNPLTLLIRRVDDPHPYYRRVKVDLRAPGTTVESPVARLKSSLGGHLNVTKIERVVLNDLIVITSDVDVLALDCDDRLEVFYVGCGPPTRVSTMMSTVDGVRSFGASSLLSPCLRESDTTAIGYLLLFTIRSGIGTSVWSAYNSASGNASTPIVQAADTASDAGQPTVFRSDALDNLDELRLRLRRREILLVVYDQFGAPAVRLTFDIGGGPRPLTRLDWFSRTRLTASWPVANVVTRPAFNFFSAEGDTAGVQRRFYINYNYGGCPSDAGVLAVIDTIDGCDYAKPGFSAAPMIAYTTNQDGAWHSGIKQGRRMSIFVR